MYTKEDIRSQLATAANPPVMDAATPTGASHCLTFAKGEPDQISAKGSRTWTARGESLVLIWTEAVAGDIYEIDTIDESTVLLSDNSAAIRAVVGDESRDVDEEALIVLPPGHSTLTALTDGPFLRLVSTQNSDVVQTARNAAGWEADPRVAPWQPWPDPVGGYALRVYLLAKTPISEGRFGRIFRTSNMMINFCGQNPETRDPRKLSPHSHDDFEQYSVSVKGNWVHHLRHPWGPDSTLWRDDEHISATTPSVTVIPASVIHTSQGIGHHELLDIFAPPRADFSAQPGWVLNADDYPTL